MELREALDVIEECLEMIEATYEGECADWDDLKGLCDSVREKLEETLEVAGRR